MFCLQPLLHKYMRWSTCNIDLLQRLRFLVQVNFKLAEQGLLFREIVLNGQLWLAELVHFLSMSRVIDVEVVLLLIVTCKNGWIIEVYTHTSITQ
jgi:hypothetical protein